MVFTPRLRPQESPMVVENSSLRAPVFSATSPEIIWLNNRPFWIHGILGSGGFATVFKVEMLIPPGFQVDRDADGALIFNEEGCVAVHLIGDSSGRSTGDADAPNIVDPTPASGGGANGGRSRVMDATDPGSDERLGQALEASSVPPRSMSFFRLSNDDASVNREVTRTPNAQFLFFRVEHLSGHRPPWSDSCASCSPHDTASLGGASPANERSQVAARSPDLATLQAEAGVGVNAGQQRGSDVGIVPPVVVPTHDDRNGDEGEDSFAVTSGNDLFGSGVFFALKAQGAKSKKQLEGFVKEVENLRKLRGSANVVQIRDHALLWGTLHLFILMELGACDLLAFLKRLKYSLSVADVSRIWPALVRAVDAAHQQDIIHRDLKPQNFLLVPEASPFADRILATTSTPPKNFRFRILDEHDSSGDVEVTLHDSWTGQEVALRLIIKLSDFGLAQPLELTESHLSVHGHAGTLTYMAPETVQPTTDGRRKLSKGVDIWSLGMMLFQMLHGGRTPYDDFFKKGDIEAAVAIASELVHTDVVKFKPAKVWEVERRRLEQDFSGEDGSTPTVSYTSKSAALISAWLRAEIFFRMCERCLAFEASDRTEAADLIRWVEHCFDNMWWREKICENAEDPVFRLSLSPMPVPLPVKDEDQPSATVDLVAQMGERMGQVLFPDLWFRNDDVRPKEPCAEEPCVVSAIISPPEKKEDKLVDLECGGTTSTTPLTGRNPSGYDGRADGPGFVSTDERRRSRCKFLAIAVSACVMICVVSFVAIFVSRQFSGQVPSFDLEPENYQPTPPTAPAGGRIEPEEVPLPESTPHPEKPESAHDVSDSEPAVPSGPTNNNGNGGAAGVSSSSGPAKDPPAFLVPPPASGGRTTATGSPAVPETTSHLKESASAPMALAIENEKNELLAALDKKDYTRHDGSGTWKDRFSSASKEVLANKEAMLTLVKRRGLALQFASPELRGDREIVLAAVTKDAECSLKSWAWLSSFEWASEKLRGDRETVLAVVAKHSRALEWVSEELREDKDVVRVAVENSGLALQFASTKPRGDREIVLAAVTKDAGYSFQWASEKLRGDREIVLAAVTKSGWALEFAPEELRGDREIVLAAVTNDGWAFQLASKELREDREFVLAAVKNFDRSSPIQFASEQLLNDVKFMCAVAVTNENALNCSIVPADIRRAVLNCSTVHMASCCESHQSDRHPLVNPSVEPNIETSSVIGSMSRTTVLLKTRFTSELLTTDVEVLNVGKEASIL